MFILKVYEMGTMGDFQDKLVQDWKQYYTLLLYII